ncbi:hypothetical protein ACWD6I_00710 [Streptomyces sp. NPDC002454]
MTINELIAFARELIDGPPPAPGAPVVREVPDPDGSALAALDAAITGTSKRTTRSLVLDGFVDPTLTDSTGATLVAPFGPELRQLRAWIHRSHAVGFGRLDRPDGPRTVLVVAHRDDPAHSGFPAGSSWAERLAIVVGLCPQPLPDIDWPAVEAALGTALPRDYKEIADLFGDGTFDDYVLFTAPNPSDGGIVLSAEVDARYPDLWEPHHTVHPAPGGLLRWASSEYDLDFVWQTGAPDPDDWPVLVGAWGEWERFDCGVGEFLLRMLVDEQAGFPTTRLDTHYFMGWEGEEE